MKTITDQNLRKNDKGMPDYRAMGIEFQGMTICMDNHLAKVFRNSLRKADWPFQDLPLDPNNPLAQSIIYLPPQADLVRRRIVADIADLPDSWLIQIHQAIASKNSDIRPLCEAEKATLTKTKQ
jgi:hypothetical protein